MADLTPNEQRFVDEVAEVLAHVDDPFNPDDLTTMLALTHIPPVAPYDDPVEEEVDADWAQWRADLDELRGES